MSATNRGRARIEYDSYYTPEDVIHNFLNNYNLDMNGLHILEPSAGTGNFCKVLRERYPTSKISAIELNEENKNILKLYCDSVKIGDFLSIVKNINVDIVIGNPPYSLALEFMEKLFKITKPNTKIIMLLRTAFLESKKRHNFWQKHPLNGLYTLSQRPSFTGTGTDATSYSIMVWDGTEKQVIKVI